MSAELIAVGIVLKVVDAEMYDKLMRWEFKLWEMVDVIVPARISQCDFVDTKNLVGELCKLVCSVDPMGVFRQNLTWFAMNGKMMQGSLKDDFALPKFIENLPPAEWQKICGEYCSDMQTKGAINHSYLKKVRELQQRTMQVLMDAFMLVGEIKE